MKFKFLAVVLAVTALCISAGDPLDSGSGGGSSGSDTKRRSGTTTATVARTPPQFVNAAPSPRSSHSFSAGTTTSVKTKTLSTAATKAQAKTLPALTHLPQKNTCALNQMLPARPSPLLGSCRQFANYACCDAAVAKKARAPFTAAHPFASCPGCVHNLATLQCAIQCSPIQSRFIVPAVCPPGIKCDGIIPVAKPTVQICESFCVALFRSCGKVMSGATSIADKYFAKQKSYMEKAGAVGGRDYSEEVAAAREFCLDQFDGNKQQFAVSIVEYSTDMTSESRCFGHGFGESIVGFSVDCDPFEDERFWHVMSESMEFKHGLGLALVSLMLIAATVCVGYAMTVARRRAEWVSERWVQEKDGRSKPSPGRDSQRNRTRQQGFPREDANATESDSLLFSQQMDAAEDGSGDSI